MGNEASCSARFGGETSDGKALLETRELIFRGDFRLVVPLSEISNVVAGDGNLEVHFPRGVLTLALGPQAEKWAAKIRSPKSRIDKLGVRAGHLVSLVGVDDAELLAELTERGAEVASRPRKGSDVVFLAIEDRKALPKIETARAYLKPDGALWILRPKGRPEVSEADVMAAGKAAGLVDVKVAAYSATHTAEKFVIPVARR